MSEVIYLEQKISNINEYPLANKFMLDQGVLDRYMLMVYSGENFAYISVNKNDLTNDPRLIFHGNSDEINGLSKGIKHSIVMKVGDVFKFCYIIHLDKEKLTLESYLGLADKRCYSGRTDTHGVFDVGSENVCAQRFLDDLKKEYTELLYQRILRIKNLTIN